MLLRDYEIDALQALAVFHENYSSSYEDLRSEGLVDHYYGYITEAYIKLLLNTHESDFNAVKEDIDLMQRVEDMRREREGKKNK